MSKIFVIGDIHGCYDELLKLIDQASIGPDDQLIALGDIVDRGDQSVEVYQFLRNRPNTIVLMGNHERKHLRGILSYSQEIVKVQFGDGYKDFVHWVDSLPYFYETPDAIIVHAFFEHDQKLQLQREDVLSGTTAGSRYLEGKYGEGRHWYRFYRGEKPVIYGHHVVGHLPKIYQNTYGIDTGSCHGGRLTALELPGFKIHQATSAKDYWKEAQSIWQLPVLKAKNWEGMTFVEATKQLRKLDYKKDTDVKQFLHQKKQWLDQVGELLTPIQHRLEEMVAELQAKYGNDFNQEVAHLSYRSFVFQARGGKLTQEVLRKSLDTPGKVISLAGKIGLKIDGVIV
ncbi:MAG: metallophosphoesterase [Bacteroidota bacterium]